MTEKDSFKERVLKVLTLQAAHQTALQKGDFFFWKKSALSKVFSWCDFIKGLSASYQALLTISIIPETVSSDNNNNNNNNDNNFISIALLSYV